MVASASASVPRTRSCRSIANPSLEMRRARSGGTPVMRKRPLVPCTASACASARQRIAWPVPVAGVASVRNSVVDGVAGLIAISALRARLVDGAELGMRCHDRRDLAPGRHRGWWRQIAVERAHEIEVLGEVERPAPLRLGPTRTCHLGLAVCGMLSDPRRDVLAIVELGRRLGG